MVVELLKLSELDNDTSPMQIINLLNQINSKVEQIIDGTSVVLVQNTLGTYVVCQLPL